MVSEVLSKNAPKVCLGTARRWSVIIGEVEVGDAPVESSPKYGSLSIQWSIMTEVMPQP